MTTWKTKAKRIYSTVICQNIGCMFTIRAARVVLFSVVSLCEFVCLCVCLSVCMFIRLDVCQYSRIVRDVITKFSGQHSIIERADQFEIENGYIEVHEW